MSNIFILHFEISSYLVGQIDSAVSEDDFADFEL